MIDACGDPHVASDVRAKCLVKTDTDETVGLASEVDDLPFLPVLAPCAYGPAPPRSGFSTIARSEMGDARMSDLNRSRTGDRRGFQSTLPLQGEEGGADGVPPGLKLGVRGCLEGGRVLNRRGAGDSRNAKHDSSVRVPSDSFAVRLGSNGLSKVH